MIARLAPFALLLAAAQPVVPAPAGDATAQALQGLTAKDVRVATIAYRLQTGAVALCSDRTALPGIVVQHVAQYRADLRPAASALYDFGGGAAIVGVVPGSAAERAGLRVRDRILAIGGIAVPAIGEGDAPRRAGQDEITELLDLVARAFAAGPVRLAIERDGRPQEIEVTGAPGCASTVQLELGGGVNAGADGNIVTVSQRMADTSPDDGLAYVIAHELSHNILRHGARLDAQKVNRGLLAGFGKNRTRILATEMEADYHAIYLLNAAGFAIDGVPAYWRGMGKYGPGIFGDGTHLGNAARVRFLQRVIDEVHAKRARGGAVRPDYAAFAAAGGLKD